MRGGDDCPAPCYQRCPVQRLREAIGTLLISGDKHWPNAAVSILGANVVHRVVKVLIPSCHPWIFNDRYSRSVVHADAESPTKSDSQVVADVADEGDLAARLGSSSVLSLR